MVRNISVPMITPALPATSTDRAVIVLPGGAMHFLSYESEGTMVSEFIREADIAAFLLKYRVVPTPSGVDDFNNALRNAYANGLERSVAAHVPLAVSDAERAIEMVRSAGYRHVTLIGFSAGARVTAEVVLRSAVERQPDAAALIYLPTVRECSATTSSPPLFIAAAVDDPLGIDGSLDCFTAWRSAGRPVELHLYEQGSHGFGMRASGLPVDQWSSAFLAWHRTHTA
jgi:acetyl esterase/lipase